MRDMRCILRIAMQVIHHVIDKIEYSWDAKRTLKSSAENQLKFANTKAKKFVKIQLKSAKNQLKISTLRSHF